MQNLAAGIGIIKQRLNFANSEPDKSGACPVCDGEGLVIETDAHGRSFTRPCSQCNALAIARRRCQLKKAKAPRLPEKVDACQKSIEYVDSFTWLLHRRCNWILFSGRSGSGKTTNATWIARNVIKRYAIPTRFYNAFEVTRRLSLARGVDREQLLKELKTIPLVVLDDFLKVAPNQNSFTFAPFFESTLEILWGRDLEQLPTVITTQMDFQKIAAFDAALANRIIENSADRVVVFGKGSNNRRLNHGETKKAGSPS